MMKPQIIETLDFETLYNQRKQHFLSLCNTEEEKKHWQQRLLLESEPVVKLLQENAYLEMLLRNRINQAVLSCYITTAKGTDLDNLAVFYGEIRQVLQRADENKKLPEIKESDEAFRKRIILSLFKLANTGSIKGYTAQAFSVSPHVLDVYIESPEGGRVDVYLYAEDDKLDDLQNQVEAHLNRADIKTLCDIITIRPYMKKAYNFTATITLTRDATDQTKQAIEKKIHQALTAKAHFGAVIPHAPIIGVIFTVPTVVDVVITSETVNALAKEVPICESLSIQWQVAE